VNDTVGLTLGFVNQQDLESVVESASFGTRTMMTDLKKGENSLTFSSGIRFMFDRSPGIAGKNMFQKWSFVILEDRRNNRRVIS
jgi:hypothetical protein